MSIKNSVLALAKDGALLSLEDMMRLDPSTIRSSQNFRVPAIRQAGEPKDILLQGKDLIGIYYLQAASIVGFLIDRYGADDFTAFCRELRDGARLDEALADAYPLDGLADLEKEWFSYITTGGQ